MGAAGSSPAGRTTFQGLGLSDLETTGTFRWVAKHPSALDPATATGLWAPGEPNNIGTEHCTHFGTGNADRINNIDCSSTPDPNTCECDRFANDPTTYP